MSNEATGEATPVSAGGRPVTDGSGEVKPPRRKARQHRTLNKKLMGERRRIGLSFVAGLVVLVLIQIPAVAQSFLGGPDREMMNAAFELRSDVVTGTADPILLMDIDDRTLSKLSPEPFAMPADTTPRGAMADLLDYIRAAPAAQVPRVVVLDVDIAQPPSDGEQGQGRLQSALAQWAASPTAPPLIISRQTYPASLFGANDNVSVLPRSAYDDVVQRAPNIYWSTPKVLGDMHGVINEFAPFECVSTPAGVQPLYSAALLAYQFAERDPNALARAPAKHWMVDAVGHCRAHPDIPVSHGERIDYHLSLGVGGKGRVWPDLDRAWPGFRTCGDTDKAILRRLSAIDIIAAAQAGGDLSHELLCQRIVMIGGTNSSAGDFVQTPLDEMNGSVVLANAIRGLELTHGGLRPIPFVLQVVLLLAVCFAFSACDIASDRIKRHHRNLRRRKRQHDWRQRLAFVALNPLFMNAMIAILAHLLGIGLLLITLNFGFWGFVSAPAFAVAITETIQEFSNG